MQVARIASSSWLVQEGREPAQWNKEPVDHKAMVDQRGIDSLGSSADASDSLSQPRCFDAKNEVAVMRRVQ